MYKKIIVIFLACSLLLILPACDGLDRSAQDTGRNDTLIDILTPEGAEVVTDVEDLLILDSLKPYSELIDFYKTVIVELYIQETGLNDSREGIWIYSGIFEGIKPITIEMRESGESVRIYIIY